MDQSPSTSSQPANSTNSADNNSSARPAHLAELERAFGSRPRTIPPRWLYDERGSQLFDEITRLPEYYQTEAEREILATHATMIAEISGATTVIELGSGTSDKTRTLLDAFVAHGEIRRFCPLDVSEATLLEASTMLGERYPDLAVEPVVGDFTRHLHRLPQGGTRLVAFLGSTIGNFYLEERRAFLGALQVINTEVGGNIDVGNFEYAPLWDDREHRIDMRLRASEAERVYLEALDMTIDFESGEELRVEISTKFRRDDLLEELHAAGFVGDDFLVDSAGDFGLALVCRTH
ncbi:MAG: L-histidine N(alpha)-methyltransferase [Actinobacteria bacterium]|nr:L-histidine N(alpha)-methyltransferase [Actinomycetota bacterium]